MNAVAITVIGVVGTALFGMFFMQFQNLREDMKEGFRQVNGRLDHPDTGLHALHTQVKDFEIRLTDKFTSQLKEHGERLARIEANWR